jgi:hypothetical protein
MTCGINALPPASGPFCAVLAAPLAAIFCHQLRFLSYFERVSVWRTAAALQRGCDRLCRLVTCMKCYLVADKFNTKLVGMRLIIFNGK